jgi:hypothetical protein
MENLDLDIENYELEDILNLFKIPYDFDINDLKKAKCLVKQTHPDKSKLNPDIFIFFLKAYKVIYYLYEFKNRNNRKETNYNTLKLESETVENSVIIEKMKDREDFNKIFNKLFEKNKIKNEYDEGGYGDWIKSNENICNEKVSSTRDMNNYILKEKEKVRSIVKQNDIKEINNQCGSDLTNSRPENYSSSIFSRLNYEDLKKAHQESLIPVTHRDFIEKEKYSSLNHLQQSRSSQNTKPLSLSQSKDFLNKRNKTAEEINTSRAFKLAKQAEEAKKLHKSFFEQYNQLTN